MNRTVSLPQEFHNRKDKDIDEVPTPDFNNSTVTERGKGACGRTEQENRVQPTGQSRQTFQSGEWIDRPESIPRFPLPCACV